MERETTIETALPVSAKPGSSRIPRGQAVTVAMWVLGCFAALQLIAVAWAVVPRLRLEPLALPEQTPVGAHLAVEPEAAAPTLPVDAGGEVFPAPESQEFPEGFEMPPPLTFEDPAALKDTAAADLVRKGNQLRAAGDANGALGSYNEALSRVPGHPRVLSEIAMTYDAMGLSSRALESWQSIYGMGKERAGELYFLAEMKLRGRDLTAEAASSPSGMVPGDAASPGQVLSVSEVREVRDPDTTSGETVRLQITLRGMPGVAIDATQFEAHVLFFDLVDGTRIEQTTADAPVSRWASEPPIDWAGGSEETLEVTYFQPSMSPAERSVFGSRAYYGYVVRVFYDGRLADAIASSEALLTLAETQSGDREVDPPPLDPGLFPAVPR